MDGALQSRIKPHDSPRTLDYNDAKVVTPGVAQDGDGSGKVSFRDLLMNSNMDAEMTRSAQKNGNGLAGAKTDEEFHKMLSDRANKDVLRKPQNDLDKDAFLKLFVTQMQNQDPLNPDDSSQMAAQLAQFNGLEQMLNVNKNLEKMQSEQTLSRNLSLLGFVGKEVSLDGGKLKVENGKLTDASFKLEKDAPRTTLEVRDASGVVVGTKDIGQLKSGDHKIEWDGMGLDGRKVANGVYTFSVLAKDLNNQDVPVKVQSTVKVTGVDLKDGGGSFYTELGRVRISEVSSVGEESFASNARAADAAGEAAAKELKARSAAAAGAAAQGVPPDVIQAAMRAAAAQADEEGASSAPEAPEAPAAQPPAPAPTPAAVGTAMEIPVPPPAS